MDHYDSFVAAVSECEFAASTRGHKLGQWNKVTEELHVSMCVVCSDLAWVTQLRDEKRWRIGGTAGEQDCSEDGLGDIR